MYYLAILSLDMAYLSLGKLAYSDPRPYYVDENIKAFVCEKEFGNPSGHSSGAFLILITVFVDVFHGFNFNNT